MGGPAITTDIKCAAILKLIYLEMFGHSMSWASFHVLEVMSSQKFVQKRVGYLAAVQSFRLDTDVLMLATNLLKKDLCSPNQFELSLAINGLSHIVSPSLAQDLAPDLIAKMNHSSPYIRKKAVLVMYKIFLQYPEALRTSFPRLRERLEDSDETVVSATVNVVCELARKNPKNYLPLAPQLFNLLTTSKNNWMTIKIIKLFASLTPLEPRLVKKLVPPISNIIQTTTAMSLLYECINGLISGGLLSHLADSTEGEDLAVICLNKLRGFLVEGDSNLKYVALLALTKMTRTHGYLVAAEKDAILECIDDEDVSIRLRALELVVGMVDVDIMQQVVGRLLRQLKPVDEGKGEVPVEEVYDYDDDETDDDGEEKLTRRPQIQSQRAVSLPDDYKDGVIRRILEMCSKDTYANMPDFEWYIDVLVQLVRYCPSERRKAGGAGALDDEEVEEAYAPGAGEVDVGEEIGRELRNVAVRVKTVRRQATEAAELLVGRSSMMFPATGGGGRRVLLAAVWIVGEYAEYLRNPNETINSLLQPSNTSLPPDVVATYIQALPKVYSYLTSNDSVPWTAERKTILTLLTARVVEFLESLGSSPHLEVQERAVGFLEIFRLAKEAIAEQPANGTVSRSSGERDDEADAMQEVYDPPLILTQAIPSLFHGFELNPVAPRAQRKVPLLEGLDLDAPINPQLAFLLSAADYDAAGATEDEGADTAADEEFERFYHRKPVAAVETASQRIDRAAAARESTGGNSFTGSYQSSEDTYLDPDIMARRKAERREKNRDDPFYIGGPGTSGRTTPNPLGGEHFDIDSIPIMKLDLGDGEVGLVKGDTHRTGVARAKVEIAGDEGAGDDEDDGGEDNGRGVAAGSMRRKGRKGKGKNILNADGSNLIGFSLEEPEEDLLAQEEEVARARKEVEKLRGEMARAAEKVRDAGKQQAAVEAAPTPTVEATKKKKKKMQGAAEGDDDGGGGEKKKARKKKNKEGGGERQQPGADGGSQGGGSAPVVKKKKKKRRLSIAEAGGRAGEDAG
ncbi:hypothetical protein DRE_04534 [Drechslerella stenobrocha 248]|uniref:AP-3 complex subunit delta n=1 Tax=Drechslerella stenobrocha 248 TaxID=1043628 RepID=W7HPU5_9PEZI|nr:hypothetical protein DRE_04534 [Drechslerella stenobrocha 248]